MKKSDYVKEMLSFWDSYANNAYDYPSLDYYYEDGQDLKFYIQPREYMGIPCVGCVIGGELNGHTFETGCFIPIAFKKSLKTWITQVMDNVYEKFTVPDEIKRRYENLR